MSTKQLAGVVAVALAAAGALVARRRRSAEPSAAPAAPPTPWAPVPASTPAAERVADEYTCECGHALRQQGTGRHTVYWEPAAAVSDPLLDPECPACGRPLPREHAERS